VRRVRLDEGRMRLQVVVPANGPESGRFPGGFLTVLILQPYIIGNIIEIKVDFAVMMVVGTLVSFSIMMLGKTE